APKSVKSTAYAKAKVSTSLSKHYKTGKIGSTTYYYFHKNTDVISTTTMNYYKGRKQRLELQVYSQGKWYTGVTEYFKLGTNGRSVVNLGHAGQSGIRARVRSSYINASSGDNVNSTTHGAWKYFIFTK
ncbi:Ig-like domain repeat protein, partial [Streptomyces sp. NPDC005969]